MVKHVELRKVLMVNISETLNYKCVIVALVASTIINRLYFRSRCKIDIEKVRARARARAREEERKKKKK